jgi:hypothetical protein
VDGNGHRVAERQGKGDEEIDVASSGHWRQLSGEQKDEDPEQGRGTKRSVVSIAKEQPDGDAGEETDAGRSEPTKKPHFTERLEPLDVLIPSKAARGVDRIEHPRC